MVVRLKERRLQEIITQVRSKIFEYEPREKTLTNWGNYDAAQCREIVTVLELIRELVNVAEERVAARNALKPPKGRPSGRPPEIPASDVAKVLLLQTYFGAANRVAEGLEILFSDRLGLRTEFSYKTIERGYDDSEVIELLDEVRVLSNEPVQKLENDFSVDGTGHPTSSKQDYESDRGRQREENAQNKLCEDSFPKTIRPYVATSAIIGFKYKLYASWSCTTDTRIGERSLFDEVFNDAIELHPTMQLITGDGIYANRPTCSKVGSVGVKPVFLPARNVTMKKKGVAEWPRMLACLADTPQDYLRVYHQRSISETGFSMDARAFTAPIRKRLNKRKETASSMRFLCHNIKRLAYLKFLHNEIQITFSNHPKLAS